MAFGGMVATMAGLGPSAGAATFGTPLGSAPFNVVPNNPYDCSRYQTLIGPAPVYSPAGPPALATSCIWADVPTPAETAAAGGTNISLEPPATGTVTRIRVGVGATTGPMKVVVMRALYSNTITPGRPNDACCFPVARSQIFTPQANSITTVNVSLPVREDATPPPEDITTIADFDTLGLAVLEPRVPVPMYYTGDLSAPADFLWNTSTPSTITPGFYSDTGGFFVALNADWTAGTAGGGGGGGGGAGAIPIDFGNKTAPVRHGNADVTLRCATDIRCAGQLLLQDVPLPRGQTARSRDQGTASKAHQAVTYGAASFRIAAHGRKAIVIHLSKAGKQLLARHRTAQVWANVKLTGSATKSYDARIKIYR